jgi:dynein light intermediate chain 1
MIGWRDRGRGTTSLDTGGANTVAGGDITLPLGPGEWDEALGLPLCVVCQNVRSLLKEVPEDVLC